MRHQESTGLGYAHWLQGGSEALKKRCVVILKENVPMSDHDSFRVIL